MANGDNDDFDLEGVSHEETSIEEQDDESLDEDDGEGDEREQAASGQKLEGEAEENGQVAQRGGRASARIAALAAREKQKDEELDRIKRELDEIKAERNKPREVDPELERQRLELMTPEERMEYRLNKMEELTRRETARLQTQLWESSDRAAFASMAASNPLVSKYKDQVESLFQQEMRKGNMLSREVLLKYVVGENMLKRAPKAASTQRKAGQERIERQKVTPSNARGNVSASRRGEQTLEDRLDGVFI
jgi:hypothetical protein